MSLVEDSYYEHDEYGRIKLINIDDVARFETGGTVHVRGVGNIPAVQEEDISSFKSQVEPADISLDPPISQVGETANQPR